MRPMEAARSGDDTQPQLDRAYDVSTTDSGLISIRWKRTASEEESKTLMSLIEAYWAQDRDYAVTIVPHPAVDADARHRRFWGEWHERNRARINRHCRGVAIVSESALMRALMTVMSWFSKDAYPVKFVASEAEARAWAFQRLIERAR